MEGISNNTGIFPDLCTGSNTIFVSDENGCIDSIVIEVTSTSGTIANYTYTPSSITIFDNIVNFLNQSINADQYLWEITGDNGYSATYNTTDLKHIFPSDTGAYLVCLTAINSDGCDDLYCTTLLVKDDIAVFVPNAFTPNGDEYNQLFRAYVNGIDIYDFDFYIFNRWGELIWENHNPDMGWDGTYNGKIVQDGTYTWKMTIKDPQIDDRKTYVGHVSVLR